MPSHSLPEVSEPSTVAVDPCVAARCAHPAERAVVLRIGGRDQSVRLCETHAVRMAPRPVPVAG